MLDRLLEIIEDVGAVARRMLQRLSNPYTLGILIGAVAFWWLFASASDGTALARLGDVGTALFRMASIGFVAGATAMSTVQFWKNLTPVRGAFHVRYLTHYFRSDDLLKPFYPHIWKMWREGGHRRDLEWQWNGSAEQVVGQVSQLAQFVIARPRGRVELLRTFAGPEGVESVMEYVSAVEREATETGAARIQELAFDVRHHVEQNLDSLLLRMKARWQRRIRAQAATVSMFIGLTGAFVFVDGSPLVLVSTMLSSLVFGGFFAWFTRDIVAAVEKWRG